MKKAFRLPARVQPQVWVNDNAVDTGTEIEFDAHDAMLSQPARRFRAIAKDAFSGRGHDYDELAIDSGVVDDWLTPGSERTIRVTVDEDDFEAWLAHVGITPEEAFSITDERLAPLRPSETRGPVDGVAKEMERAGDLSCYAAADALRSLMKNWKTAAEEGNADAESFKDDYRRLVKELQDRQDALFEAIDGEFTPAASPGMR